MGYPTRVQLIQRQDSRQWYINFPAPLAHALEFQKGEIIEWVIQDKNTLILRRREMPHEAPPQAGAKKKRLRSGPMSRSSGTSA
jgi:hypothetical protein